MEKTNGPVVVAVFDQRGQAEAAIDELWRFGFPRDDVGIVGPRGSTREATTATEQIENKAGDGAATGAMTGGAIGAVAGAAAVSLIPGLGPVLAGGILAGVLGGAAAGAAAGAYLGPFVALGFSEDDARAFESQYKAGRTVVAVRAGDMADKAAMTLRSHGGHDLKTTKELAGVR